MWQTVAPGFRIHVSYRRLSLWAYTPDGPVHVCDLDPVATAHALEDATFDFRGLDIEADDEPDEPPMGRLLILPGGRQG